MDIVKTVAANIKAARKEKDLTQQQVAEKIGLKRQGYAVFESGDQNFRISMLEKICEVLEIEVFELFKTN